MTRITLRGSIACLLCMMMLSVEARAQWASVRGQVEDPEHKSLPGVNLMLTGETGNRTGTATDADGRFMMTHLPPGRYIFTASFVGYRTRSDTLILAFGQQASLDVRLEADETTLDEIVVETMRRPERRSAGLIVVQPSALARTPMPDVTYDLAGYLLTLPGFVSPGDQGGQLFVRGGTPTQNLVQIDGMTLYQPFHIVGFYSAFPADIISYADVYAGGFGAQYGGRISSVIDVSTRNGSKQRVAGAVSIAPFLSSVRAEIPVVRGKASLIVSVRESIIDRVSSGLIGRDLPFRFGDQFFKFHAFLNKNTTFSATAIRTFDKGNIAAKAGDTSGPFSTWRNEAYGGRFTYLPTEEAVMTRVAVYTSRLESRYRLTATDERRAKVQGFNADILFTYLLGPSQIHFGIFAGTNQFDFNLGQGQTPGNENVTSGGGFVQTNFNLDERLRIAPGVRLQSFSNGPGTTLDPRFRLTWLPRGNRSRQQFSLAWGRYHQQINGINNDQDVTNVFTVWSASPAGLPVPEATHFIAGWQRRVWPWLELTAEGYYKRLHNISFPQFSPALDRVATFAPLDGRVRGLDVRLELNRPVFYGQISYSLSKVEYEPRSGPNRRRFSPPHDRRHQLNALVQVARGPYRLSLRWQYGSGRPFTQIDGYYDALTLTPGEGDFHTQTGQASVSRNALYGSHLPAYHRLDVSAQRVFRMRNATVTAQVGVVNAYDRDNIFQYNVFSGERVNQLPLIPSLGLKVEMQ